MKNYLREKKGGKPQRHLTPWLESRSGKLKSGYLKNINPCLWLLLKKMLIFEAGKYPRIIGKGGEVVLKKDETRDQVIDHYLGDILEYNSTFVNRIKGVWNRQEFCFLESDLDKLCQAIKSFGNFKDWSEFERVYGHNTLSIVAQQYKDTYFSLLSKKEKDIIEAMASYIFSMNVIVINENVLKLDDFSTSDFNTLIEHLKRISNDSKNHKLFLVLLTFLKTIAPESEKPKEWSRSLTASVHMPAEIFTLIRPYARPKIKAEETEILRKIFREVAWWHITAWENIHQATRYILNNMTI